jgi:acylphosphatase
MRVYTVKGRVQGVWFRDSTRREALKLKIHGYAKNLANGDVEVLAIGEMSALDSLYRWLHEGPPLARVSEVQKESVRPAEPLLPGASFKIA